MLWPLRLRETDTVLGRMTALIVALLASLRVTIFSRLELAAEILALRHQLAVLQRNTPKRPAFSPLDRLVWIVLSSVWPNWRHAVQIVTPATVVRWHRRAFAAYWRWNSRRGRISRPALASDLRALVRQMGEANPLWGAPRVHGELQKLGIHGSQAIRGEVTWASPWVPVPIVAHSSPITSPGPPRSTSSPVPPPPSACYLSVCGVVSRPTPHRPRERHGASDRGVDRATAPRGVAVEYRVSVRHPGSGCDLRSESSTYRAADGHRRKVTAPRSP